MKWSEVPTTRDAAAGRTFTVNGGTMVMVAVLKMFVSAAAAALTVTCAGVGTLPGAVYNPVEEMLPQVAPLHPLPLTLQFTAVFELPVTVAVNCCCRPVTTVAEPGERFTMIGRRIVSVAEADLVGSATEVAVTNACAGLGTVAGAV